MLKEPQKAKGKAKDRKTNEKSRFESLWAAFFLLSFLPGLASFSLYPPVTRGVMGTPNWWWLSALILAAFVTKASLPFIINTQERSAIRAAFFIMTTPIFALNGVGCITLFNGIFDRSPNQKLELFVASLQTRRTKQGQSYYVYVTDWRQPNSQVRLSVGHDLYAQLPIGSKIRVTTKPGLLGAEWLVDIRAATP